MCRPADPPSHDATRERIDDEGGVTEILPCRHISKVAVPQYVRRWCFELTVHLVQRTWLIIVGDRRSSLLAANDVFDPSVFHQLGNSAAGNITTFATHLVPKSCTPRRHCSSAPRRAGSQVAMPCPASLDRRIFDTLSINNTCTFLRTFVRMLTKTGGSILHAASQFFRKIGEFVPILLRLRSY